MLNLASKCPLSLISPYAEVPGFIAEFNQIDNLCDVKFVKRTDSDSKPFAFRLDQASISYMIENPINAFKISFVFDLKQPPDKMKRYNLLCDKVFSKDYVFNRKGGEIVN